MRWMFAVLVFAMMPFSSIRAAHDDNDADLKESPEDLARMAVLKRWPDAQNIDAIEEAEDEEEVADAPGGKGALDKPEDNLPEQMLPENEASDWIVSVTFTSGEKEFEVLANDDGQIRYVYEEVAVDDTPTEVLKGARARVKEGDFLYVDKILNEHRKPAVATFVVGVGERDVYVDENGKVLKVVELRPRENELELREVEGAL